MSPKPLLILSILTVLFVVGGLALDSGEARSAGWDRAGTPLFEGLEERIQDVDEIVTESSGGRTTLRRDEDGESGARWVVVERSDYPARADEVERVLKGAATATLLEPKTRKPENYAKLGLAGIDEEGSPAVHLILRAGEEVLADVFVGNRRFRGAGESWYVRLGEDPQVWAVDGKLRVPHATADWLDNEVVNVGRDRIARVVIQHSDGERIELARKDPSAGGFTIENLPDGRKPRTENSAPAMLGALDRLRIQDVAPSAGNDQSGPPVEGPPDTVTTFLTKDGLQVTCELWIEPEGEDGSETIRCRFTPSIDEMTAPPPLSEPPAEEGAPPPPDPRGELEKEVTRLRERTEGWIFTLPSWKKGSFTTRLEDLLEELPPSETDGDDAEAVPSPDKETQPPGDDGATPPSGEGNKAQDTPGDGEASDSPPQVDDQSAGDQSAGDQSAGEGDGR